MRRLRAFDGGVRRRCGTGAARLERRVRALVSAIDASSADAKSTSANPTGASPEAPPFTRYVLRLSATAVGLGAPRVTNAVDIASASSSLGTEPIHSCAPLISASAWQDQAGAGRLIRRVPAK